MQRTNGLYVTSSKKVTNAGTEHVKNVQQSNHQGFILGKVDRNQKDRRITRSYVVINQGEYKGYSGRVLFADDNIVKVELLAKDMKVDLKRN